MRYLKSYNEEILWSKKIRKAIKGLDKTDMYISEKFPGPTVADITPDKVFSGKSVPDLDMDLLKDYYIKDINNKGVFIHTPEDIYEYKFGVSFDDRMEMWYNQSHFFKKLREISNKLGYKIGTHVDIDRGGSGEITEIVNFAFYKIGYKSCDERLTLLYKVGNIYYQITQIEISKEGKSGHIIDDVIKENFYDLLDDDSVSYISEDKGNMYECKLIIHRFTTSKLHQVTEHLSIAEARLKDIGITLVVTDISKSNNEYIISFTCTKNKK